MTAPVLFYDGECGLCDRSVRWCLRHDRRRRLRFAPLQGATYAAIATPGKPVLLESLVLSNSSGLHLRSDAVLLLLREVGGGWALLGTLGRVIPRALREASYRVVARHRRRWFGGAEKCRIPAVLDRSRFLP